MSTIPEEIRVPLLPSVGSNFPSRLCRSMEAVDVIVFWIEEGNKDRKDTVGRSPCIVSELKRGGNATKAWAASSSAFTGRVFAGFLFLFDEDELTVCKRSLSLEPLSTVISFFFFSRQLLV